ncbi:hypothetical protein M422DRAFT_245758 [Sphaerobolus stellatus SS14]|nr:hypothetical protein M422DRAFT_245758 [Sphaerobolus stellatus SS14]
MQDLKNVANVNSVDPTPTARPSENASTPSAATTSQVLHSHQLRRKVLRQVQRRLFERVSVSHELNVIQGAMYWLANGMGLCHPNLPTPPVASTSSAAAVRPPAAAPTRAHTPEPIYPYPLTQSAAVANLGQPAQPPAPAVASVAQPAPRPAPASAQQPAHAPRRTPSPPPRRHRRHSRRAQARSPSPHTAAPPSSSASASAPTTSSAPASPSIRESYPTEVERLLLVPSPRKTPPPESSPLGCKLALPSSTELQVAHAEVAG